MTSKPMSWTCAEFTSKIKNSVHEGVKNKAKRSGYLADVMERRTILRILEKTYISELEVVEPTVQGDR